MNPRKYGIEEYLIIICVVIILLVVAFFITGCASQSRKVKMHYQYDTSCTLTVTGVEQQVGGKLGSGMDLTGDDCTVGRDTSVEK